MSKTLIEGGLVLPMTAPEAAARESLGIEDGKIAWMGTAPEGWRPDAAVDASGCLVTPGFANAHTHLSMVLMRNYKDQGNLFQWLGEIFPIEDHLVADDIYHASILGLAEMVRSGTVLFADMYFFPEETIRAVAEAGLKANIGLTFFGGLEDSKSRIRDRLPLMEKALPSDGRVQINAAPHAIYTTTADSYRLAADLARDLGTRLHTHLSETRKEVEDSVARFGMTPTMYLESLGIFDKAPTFLAHGVHLTDGELRLLATKDASLVHNPSSNCKLGSGIAPITRWRDAGLNMALGTDGASSNNNLDMLKEVCVATLVGSVACEDFERRLTPFEMLRCATWGGAKALGREAETGTLEPGKDADLVVWDMDAPATTPMNDPYSALVFSAGRSNVRDVFCRGRALMENGKLTTIDEESAMREARKVWESVRSRL